MDGHKTPAFHDRLYVYGTQDQEAASVLRPGG